LVPLCDVELKWAAPADSPHLGHHVQPSDLLCNRIVTMPPVSNIFQYMIDWFEGELPANLVTCDSLNTNVQMISSGYGAGIVPICLAQRAVDEGQMSFLRTIEIPLDRVYLAFHHRRERETLFAEGTAVALNVIGSCRSPGVIPLAA